MRERIADIRITPIAFRDPPLLNVAGVHQRTGHGSNAQINGVMDANGASSGALQSIARIGFSTRF